MNLDAKSISPNSKLNEVDRDSDADDEGNEEGVKARIIKDSYLPSIAEVQAHYRPLIHI